MKCNNFYSEKVCGYKSSFNEDKRINLLCYCEIIDRNKISISNSRKDYYFYQIENDSQARILDENAKNIDYYLKSRIEIEKIFNDKDFKPKRWSNYRPLWYKYYNNVMLQDNSFGQMEEIKKIIVKMNKSILIKKLYYIVNRKKIMNPTL